MMSSSEVVKPYFSKCCGAMTTVGENLRSESGTRYYICDKCHDACDVTNYIHLPGCALCSAIGEPHIKHAFKGTNPDNLPSEESE